MKKNKEEIFEHSRAFFKALGTALSDLIKTKTYREYFLLEKIKKLEEENKILQKKNKELRETLVELSCIIKK